MKIHPTMNIGSSYGPNLKKSSVSQNLSFQGQLTAAKIEKFSFDKKLSYLLNNCKPGQIIALGESMEEVLKFLPKFVQNSKNVIKNVFFLKNEDFYSPLVIEPFLTESTETAFTTNDSINEIASKKFQLMNIGEKPIMFQVKNLLNVLPNGGQEFIQDKVLISNGSADVKINFNTPKYKKISKVYDEDDLSLLSEPRNFATYSWELSEQSQDAIKIVNKKFVDIIEQAFCANKLKEKKAVEKTVGAEKQDLQEKQRYTFDDVGGLDDAVDALKKSVLYPIKFPSAHKNKRLNKGILLHGKPGTGKTLLAEALAGETNAYTIKLCGSELDSKFFGETEQKWRELFNEAKENQPSIIFIDEIDSVGGERSGSSNSVRDGIVNQLLHLMTDLDESADNVFVIGTTNRIELLDSALTRSGRFGKHIEVLPPDKKGQESIFNVHVRDKNLDSNIDREKLIDEFLKRQFTGADISYIVDEAHTKSWLRNGVYEKMEDGSFQEDELANLVINAEDFELAIADWDKMQVSKRRNPIGYKQ